MLKAKQIAVDSLLGRSVGFSELIIQPKRPAQFTGMLQPSNYSMPDEAETIRKTVRLADTFSKYCNVLRADAQMEAGDDSV
jgi:hypothetical protein